MGIKNIDTDYNSYKHHTDSYALRYNYERNFKDSYPSSLLSLFEKDLVKQMQSLDPVNEIKGAKFFIDYCVGNSIPFCFATGGLPEPSKLKLEQCNIWYDESILATSKTHESREGFVLDAIERAKRFYNQSSFNRVISFGDGLWDLRTAQNLSIDFVGVGKKNQQKFIELGVKDAFENFEQIKETLF